MIVLLFTITVCVVVMASETLLFATFRLRDRIRDRRAGAKTAAKAKEIADLVAQARSEGRSVEEIQALVNGAIAEAAE